MKPALRGFLAFLEAHGGGEVGAQALAIALEGDGASVRSMLHAEGIVRPAPRATTWPCDGLGCAREVRELRDAPPEHARRFFAVCTRGERECETVDVSEAELAQESVSVDAFVAALQRALHLSPGADLAAEKRVETPWPLGAELAGRDSPPRDVFLVRRAGPELRALLAERARAETRRATRILVLTERTLASFLSETCAADASFEVLADTLSIADGRLVHAADRRPLRAVPSSAPSARTRAVPADPARPRSPGLDGLPRATQWREITLFGVDEEDRLGVVIGGKSRRLSCIDFGLATANGRAPRQHFELLRAICFGNGDFQTRRFGTSSNGKRILSELRTALRKAFGIEENPFEGYSRKHKSWRPKFRALSASPREVEEAKEDWRGRRG